MFRKIQVDDNTVIQSYYKTKSSEKTAQMFDITPPTVLNILKRNNIQTRYGNKIRNNLIKSAIEDYKNGITFFDIRTKYGFSNFYLKKILIAEDLDIIDENRHIIKNRKDLFFLNDINNAIKMYNETHKIRVLTKFYNIKAAKIRSILRYKGIKLPKKEDEMLRLKNQTNEIIKEYIQYKSIQKVAKKFKTSWNPIFIILKDNNVDILNRNQWNKIRNQLPSAKQKLKEYYKRVNLDDSFVRKRKICAYKRKYYTLPSGKVIPLQGYETHFLDYVFSKDILKESDFDFETTIRIPYNNEHYYYPDFYIKAYNLLVEIKSSWTFSKTDPAKAIAARQSQYKYIIIIDNNFTEFTTLLESYKNVTNS
jgi:hypothetical protein